MFGRMVIEMRNKPRKLDQLLCKRVIGNDLQQKKYSNRFFQRNKDSKSNNLTKLVFLNEIQ